jgi:2-polyprenyl-6-methoxyphenol hydroxylase-like FAD-dependent oxidoreductase
MIGSGPRPGFAAPALARCGRSDTEERELQLRASIVVVGGSVVGMSAALAARRTGADVSVLERSPAGAAGGGGLGVDVTLLRQVTGLPDGPPVCHGPDRDTTAWHLLRDWLEAGCRADPLIRLHHDTAATGAAEGRDQVTVTAAGGREWPGDLAIGADGVHSTIRSLVDPEHPAARYAGFVLWRAMVPEQALAGTVPLPGPSEPSRELYAGPYRLVTYLVPGADGETAPGRRRLNMVWYDPAREELLRASGKLDGTVVEGSLGTGDLPARLRGDLRAIAGQTWPSPWREALAYAIDRQLVFGTPVAEYLPHRLVAGRVALAGDAAHAASPMVGGGFRQGLLDAAALAAALERAGAAGPALAGYQQARLGPAAWHVRHSQRASRAYLRRAASSG